MAIDISGLEFFMPIFGFVFVFVIVLALLQKTKILGGSKWIDGIISFIVAFIFSIVSPAQEYVEAVTPAFVILIIVLFFILVLIGMSQQGISNIVKPWFVWVFLGILILICLVAAAKVFAPTWWRVRDFITFEGRIVGGILLLVIAAAVAWLVTKK